MSLHLITAPARAPVTLEQAKDYLRVTGTDDDARIRANIAAATAYLDGRDGVLGRCLVLQTWELRLHEWPCGDIELPLPPFTEIVHVKYYDTSGTLQTLSSTLYDAFDQGNRPAILRPAYGQSWPAVRCRPDAIQIQYTAGYADVTEDGALDGTIPPPAIEAIMLMVSEMYDNRALTVTGTIVSRQKDRLDELLTPLMTSFV
jgi:uncharacterized phiE125 gp8 family phage protein